MIETLLGGLLGGAFRLAPEILKWLDRKGERGHELAMQDKRWSSKILRCAADGRIGASAGCRLERRCRRCAARCRPHQGEKTGVRWSDALSVSVRPVITYWFMALYCAARRRHLWLP